MLTIASLSLVSAVKTYLFFQVKEFFFSAMFFIVCENFENYFETFKIFCRFSNYLHQKLFSN